MSEEAVARYRRKLALLRGERDTCPTCNGQGSIDHHAGIYSWQESCPDCRPDEDEMVVL